MSLQAVGQTVRHPAFRLAITDMAGTFPPSVRDTTGASPPQYFPYKVKM